MSNFFVPPHLNEDFYKAGHIDQYELGVQQVYSNFTPRSTHREPAPDGIIWFGLQAFVQDYLIHQWNTRFFQEKRDTVIKQYKRVMDNCLGPDSCNINHVGELHELGYLPLIIKSLKEGTLVPYRIPVFTSKNTDDKFAWLPNKLETVFSDHLWLPPTSATTAFGYRREFERKAKQTGSSLEFVKWQGHDFSMRGMEGTWASGASGAGHLLSFTGTDTIPGILFLEQYYGGDIEKELIGGSVAATEHSVICLGMKDGERATIKRLITVVYPKGIFSLVSDTWNLWKLITEHLVSLKPEIMARDGKLVIRPDSGKPADILCGNPNASDRNERMGVIRLLYEIFGGTKNAAGYIELDPHIGAIYGDSISPATQVEILSRLAAMGFASSNVVLGIGSFTYQFATRDTDGWAMKATWAEVNGEARNLSKDPVTDSGTKKSASGLLAVLEGSNKELRLFENCSKELESMGLLEPVFVNGQLKRFQTVSEIRNRVESYL